MQPPSLPPPLPWYWYVGVKFLFAIGKLSTVLRNQSRITAQAGTAVSGVIAVLSATDPTWSRLGASNCSIYGFMLDPHLCRYFL